MLNKIVTQAVDDVLIKIRDLQFDGHSFNIKIQNLPDIRGVRVKVQLNDLEKSITFSEDYLLNANFQVPDIIKVEIEYYIMDILRFALFEKSNT